MLARFNDCHIELVQGDITAEQVDAIVNAANSGLRGGGGVDGAIHRAAGPELMAETRERYPQGCPTGSAVATAGYGLTARFVFHAVGPSWGGGVKGEAELLTSAYQGCLELAVKHECTSIAFPAISTGVYGYPVDLAAATSLAAIREFLLEQGHPALVRVVLFDGGTYGAFARVLEGLVG